MDARSATPINTDATPIMIHTGTNDRYASNSKPDATDPMAAPNSSKAVTMPVTVPKSFLPYCLATTTGGATVPMHVANAKNTHAAMGPQSVAAKHSATAAAVEAMVPSVVPTFKPKRS